MSRVNVESSAIYSIKRMSLSCGRDYKQLLGCFVLFWHETQSMEVSVLKMLEINEYFGLSREEELWKHEDLIESLVDFGFVKPVSDEEDYEIIGNLKHISNIKRLKELAKIGGEASALSRRLKRTVEPDYQAQYNTVQYNTNKDITALVEKSIEPIGSPPSDGKLSLVKLLEVYNANRGVLPKARTIGESRKSKAAAAIRDLPDESDWVALLKWINTQEFFIGKNDRGWVASLAYLIRPGKAIELFEKATSKTSGGIKVYD